MLLKINYLLQPCIQYDALLMEITDAKPHRKCWQFGSVFVVLLCDGAAMKRTDLYTLTQSASVKPMATTMPN